MTIFILIIIIIIQQNSPQKRHFIFTSNKTLKTIRLGITIREKEIRSNCNSFLPPPQSHSFLFSHPFPTTYIYQMKYRLIVLIGRVFANGLRDLGSIPGCVIPKTLKMVLDTSFLNIQQYKVRIKGKVEQSRERSSALPYILG